MLVTTKDLEAVPARLKDLSYSSLLEFHSCPRRNQLNRMRVNQTKISSVTFSFGHVVGLDSCIPKPTTWPKLKVTELILV